MRGTQKGVAIVIAMSVVALAAMAATAIMITQSTWARQGELAAAHVQAQTLVQAGVDWARAVLSDDRRLTGADHPGEPWALRLPPMPVEGGELAGFIEDQQGLFNLNNLVNGGKVDPVQLGYFQRLLSVLGLPAALAGTLADWIDADGEPQSQGGAEDETYLASEPPYLTANRALTDVGELALVNGFDEAVRARLRPFVTALPRRTPVNANTASPEVLAAIIEGLGLDGARELVRRREGTFFIDRGDFLRYLPEGVQVAVDNISFGSDFFQAIIRVTIGGAQARGIALLERSTAGWPAVVWRKAP
jgi:general secretion pathway protein K